LKTHPDVFLSATKELHFFSQHLDRGFDWYRAQFAGSQTFAAVGEITPTYLHLASPEVVAAAVPDAKLIVMLREPVASAYSAYTLCRSWFKDLSFVEAMRRHEFLRDQSLYAEPIRRWFNHFDRSRFLFLVYEDMQERPEPMLARVAAFLGIENRFDPAVYRSVINHIAYPKTQQFLRRWGLGWTVSAVKRTPLAGWLKAMSRRKHLRRTADVTAPLSEEERARFRSDLAETAALTGLDLSQWQAALRGPDAAT
jgi:hypothetical protein